MSGEAGRLIPFPEREPVEGELVDNDHDGEPDTTHAGAPGAEVAQRADDSLTEAGVPLDGELVEESRPAVAVVRRVVVAPVVRVVRDDRTQHVARRTGRHLYTAGAGFASWGKRAWDAGTMGVYRRQIRLLEAGGNRVELAEWLDRKEAAAEKRHKRLMELPTLAAGVARIAVGVLAAVVAIVLVAGLVAQLTGGRFADVVLGVLDVARWVVTAVAVAWTPFVIALPFLVTWAAYREGKRRANPPVWLMTPDERRQDTEVITPSIVVKAFRDLGIAELRKRIEAMEDGGAGMLSPIHTAGRGVEVTVQLPSAISTGDVTPDKRRQRLAENLGRHKHELFVTVPRNQPRAVTLWIADPGALSEPIEPSPLVLNPPKRVAMHRESAPWGRNLRDDVIALNLWQKHLLITGLSNMGKTASLRALVLWLLFDPTVELRLADLKGLGDWRMFRDLAKVLIEGPSDPHVIMATEMVEAGVEEMNRRLANFDADRYTDGVPPGLAGYHPIILLVDEAQVAFMCPEKDEDGNPYGGKSNRSRFFMACRQIENQGRAVNVLLWMGTQDPTDQNLPKIVREGFHIRASLKVGSPEQSGMALGVQAVNDGAAPHELQPENQGTVVVFGKGVPTPPGRTWETVFTHYINGSDARAVIEHVKAARLRSTTVEVIDVEEERDLLADVLGVLGGGDERAAQVARLLENIADVYNGLSGTALAARLRTLGVPVKAAKGYPTVRVEDVEAAIAARENGAVGVDLDG